MLKLASIVRADGGGEGMRLAADLARTLDSLLVEEVLPSAAAARPSTETSELARHGRLRSTSFS